jgi:hypothetical protein
MRITCFWVFFFSTWLSGLLSIAFRTLGRSGAVRSFTISFFGFWLLLLTFCRLVLPEIDFVTRADGLHHLLQNEEVFLVFNYELLDDVREGVNSFLSLINVYLLLPEI